jgi:hypothetical protein
MSGKVSRRPSEDSTLPSATPDVIRSTVLSLIPHLRLNEEKKRALILQVQKSDFNQQSVIEYFIGIVGVKAYDSALRSTLGQAITTSVSAPSASPATRQITGKAYCHGGDVAFFAGIDLDLEKIINSALHVKRRGRSVAVSLESLVTKTSTLEERIASRLSNTGFEFDEKYIAAAHRAICRMGGRMVEKLVLERKMRSTKKRPINTDEDLLAVVGRMDENFELPNLCRHKWEQKVIDDIVNRSSNS